MVAKRVLAAFLVAASAYAIVARASEAPESRKENVSGPSVPACSVPPSQLVRIQRGHIAGQSEDIIVIPRAFNYLGSFALTSHSGPKNYLQRVPLVLYGHGIAANGAIEDRASLADMYATAGRLFGVGLEPRAGESLTRSLEVEQSAPPRLLVVVVWDGVGNNVLERWPHAWPTLKRLSRRGTSYVKAVAGSSPSITPATHSTMSTGVFPNEHGVTGIQYRSDARTISVSFEKREPSTLIPSTIGDQLDVAFDNEAKVGLVGWRSWHIGLLGHGAAYEGGDRDDLALIGHHQRITGRRPEFRVPAYLRDFPGLRKHLGAADAADGERDGAWRGHPVDDDQDNPGWVAYQRDILKAVIKRGGYGADTTPDLLLTNFKATDRVGHLYSMDAPEMREVLRAQDRALGELVELLDRAVGDYTVVVTADHGHTPSTASSGSWPIHQRELEDDLDAHLGLRDGATVSQAMTAVGLFVDRAVMRRNEITEEEIAAFLSDYTIAENWGGQNLPEGYGGRRDERIFRFVFPARDLPELKGCVSD